MTGHGKVYEKIEGKKDGETCEDCWFLLKGMCTLSDHPTEVTDYCDGFLPNKELDEQNQSFATDDCDLPVTEITTMTEEEEK